MSNAPPDDAEDRLLRVLLHAVAASHRRRADPAGGSPEALDAGLRHDAARAAALVWWGEASIADARRELRGLYRVLAGDPYPDMDEAADAALDAALANADAQMDGWWTRTVEDTRAAIRFGATPAECMRRAARAAGLRTPPPPPYLVVAAVAEGVARAQRQQRSATSTRGWRTR